MASLVAGSVALSRGITLPAVLPPALIAPAPLAPALLAPALLAPALLAPTLLAPGAGLLGRSSRIYGREAGPMAIVHRGGAALAPENSLAAFGLSAALGFRYLETDVRVTADGHLVCFHDRGLERVTSGTGPVRSKSLADVRRLRINGTEPIPTFDEALDAFPDQCFTVDLKDRAGIGPMMKSLQRKGVAERVCIAGAWDGWLAHLRREVPAVTTALGWRSLTALLSCARAGLQPPKALATGLFAHVPVKLGRVPIFVERLVAMSHEIGVRVVTWTVDEPAVIQHLLDAGVDAIITDRPDVLRDVLIQRGAWTPYVAPSH